MTLPANMPTKTPGLDPATFDVTCPMCGQTTSGSGRWCAGVNAAPEWRSRIVPGCATNGYHLHRSCGTCGFETLQAALS